MPIFPGQGPISGDAHFDDDEPWSVTWGLGKHHALNTLVHEFGHSIGLDHSTPGTIMEPYYRGWDNNLRLTEDDIRGAQSLYGPSRGGGTPGVTQAPTTPRNCIFGLLCIPAPNPAPNPAPTT